MIFTMRRRNLSEDTEAKKGNPKGGGGGGGRWTRKPGKEGTEEASGAKEVGITSREAALRVAEKQGSGPTEPGVYGNPKKASGETIGR